LKSTNGSLIRRDDTDTVIDGTSRVTAEVKTGDRLVLGDLKSPVVFDVEVLDDAEIEAEERATIARTVVASRAFADVSSISSAMLDDPSQGHSRVKSLLELVDGLQSHLEPSSVAARLADVVFDSLATTSVAGVFFEGSHGIVPVSLRTRSCLGPLPIPWRRVEPLLAEAVERKASLHIQDDKAVPA